MIERIIAWSIRNRFLVIVGWAGLAVLGVYALFRTPVDAIPDLSENQVVVFTEWQGHAPLEIEDQITYPLSLALEGVAGVRTVRSSSDFGFSMINVIFEDDVDFQAARRALSERLAQANVGLPAGVTPRLAADALATGQIFWYTVEGSGQDLGRLRSIQDWYVKPQLSSVAGVAEVASVGGYATEYQIELDPRQLQAHGLTVVDVLNAAEHSNATIGGHLIHKGNAEFVVRSHGWLGASGPEGNETDPRQVIRDLEKVVLRTRDGAMVRLGELAAISLGPQTRRGILEKDGSEVTGGVILMRYGENPLEVTRRIKQKITELQPGLPPGVRVVPFYDRTPLIEGAIRAVTGTLLEAMITATICVLIVLLHVRTSLVISLTLPLAVLASFTIMWMLRGLGFADIQTNIMSLAGIVISIGVLVDASIVMAENAMHALKEAFGDRKVVGDVRAVVLPACQAVGRPIFFSVVIMLLSFLPVFAMGGAEGKMFRPLAFTKSFALLAVAVLAITLVPALCTIFIRGRLRREEESWVVRTLIDVYRPVLNYLLDRPAPLAWFLGILFLIGLAPLGIPSVLLGTLAVALVVNLLLIQSRLMRVLAGISLIVTALVAQDLITPLGREFMTPLDEGMVMDMPITVPRASIVQSGDDLKARDMVFCRFPEVDMVVGKAGRADTPSDPAPLDMIETMINFRPPQYWPRRKLREADARAQAAAVFDSLVARGAISPPADRAACAGLVEASVLAQLPVYDSLMREYAYQRNREFSRALGIRLVHSTVEQMLRMLKEQGTLARDYSDGDIALIVSGLEPKLAERLAASVEPEDIVELARQARPKLQASGLIAAQADVFVSQPGLAKRALENLHTALGGTRETFFTRLQRLVQGESRQLWLAHVEQLDRDIVPRAAATWTRLLLEDYLDRSQILDPALATAQRETKKFRQGAEKESARPHVHHAGADHGAAMGTSGNLPDPHPALNRLQDELAGPFAKRLLLWKKDREDLAGFGGELDRVMQMPGWTNVWTMPIQNRVDMLATGVNTAVGVRVLGKKLDDVVTASEAIAKTLKDLQGAADVVADPVRGKGYIQIDIDRETATRRGLNVGDVNRVVETALQGCVVTTTIEGRERRPVRVRYARKWRDSEESIRKMIVQPPPEPGAAPTLLEDIASIRAREGPASIKSENGFLRNYVRLNVRNRDTSEFVEEARRLVDERVALPPGVHVEWTGQFEHELRARQTLALVVPLVIVLIGLILYWTYHDLADALLMLLAVPGSIAGGVLFQWLFGYKFSMSVWIGYIACFGMATSTGIIMLVYLREALAKAGGLEKLNLDQLRQAVLNGAVHRLRPKILTEGTVVLGLAPMLWASGVGAEIIRPMAAPVLGGILIADEVIDLLLPVLFYWVRRRRWRKMHGAAGG
jgi:Cu(I)/Ag(I) efflux system membrane protein CusA/SilA